MYQFYKAHTLARYNDIILAFSASTVELEKINKSSTLHQLNEEGGRKGVEEEDYFISVLLFYWEKR